MSESSPDPQPAEHETVNPKRGLIARWLDRLEWMGNKLPDPAVLFLIGLILTWVLSYWLSGVQFTETKPNASEPVKITNMLSQDEIATFLTTMVEEFYKFPPLGIVLVALLGVAVAEHSGFINACLKSMLNITPTRLLTPMLILVAIISHTAADAGYVLVIPIGGVMFYAAGRHPLAGIAAGFAGVSGGFSANFIVSGLDPLLSSLTQTGVDIVDSNYVVNPLCNILFTAVSCIFIIGVGWFVTDKIIEPRLAGTPIDGDPEDIPKFDELTRRDKLGMRMGLLSIVITMLLLAIWAWPKDSVLRDPFGSLTAYRNTASDFGVEFKENDFPVIAAAKGRTIDGRHHRHVEAFDGCEGRLCSVGWGQCRGHVTRFTNFQQLLDVGTGNESAPGARDHQGIDIALVLDLGNDGVQFVQGPLIQGVNRGIVNEQQGHRLMVSEAMDF